MIFLNFYLFLKNKVPQTNIMSSKYVTKDKGIMVKDDGVINHDPMRDQQPLPLKDKE